MKNVTLVNPQKVFWPEDGFTKKDLFDYYLKVIDLIYPYLKDRPQSLHRFPNGINGEGFYQKNVAAMPPKWVHTWQFFSDSSGEDTNYIVPDNKETILYLVNLGCIEMNAWNSTYKSWKYPDYLVIDLDPENVSFETVIEVAQSVGEVLQEIGLTGHLKTSGATGLHIYLPMGGRYTYEQVKNFAHLLVSVVHTRIPKITSLERMPKKRQGCVYLDYLQNNLGQTMATPYSVRPRPGAPVSTPLAWTELKSSLSPGDFNIKTSFSEYKKRQKLFLPVLKGGINLEKALPLLENSF